MPIFFPSQAEDLRHFATQISSFATDFVKFALRQQMNPLARIVREGGAGEQLTRAPFQSPMRARGEVENGRDAKAKPVRRKFDRPELIPIPLVIQANIEIEY
ncbi:MAG: hypothetical protein O9293_08365 [Porphyrobacter sp.]|nr:hypothetical protein [Porphyrobacter sp.]